MTDPRVYLVALLILTAPWALVVLVALARGYDVTLTLTRRQRREGD